MVRVQASREMVEALCKLGDLDEADDLDVDSVGEAIAAAARRGLGMTQAECPVLGVQRKSILGD